MGNKLEEAKRLYQTANADQKYVLESLFPELKESEDERIKKGIIKYLSWIKDKDGSYMPNNMPFDDMIAWLEKQGQQKVSVVDFKAEDWYVSKVDGKIYNAKFMEKKPTNQARKLEIEKAALSATGIIDQEEWFIKGAEWSDKNPSCISSEKQGEQKTNPVLDIEIPFGAKDSELQEVSYHIPKGFHAEIDDDKVVIKQGEQKPYGQREECFDCQFNYAGECKGFCAMKRSEQNHFDYENATIQQKDFAPKDEQEPAWGEEDERIRQCLIRDQEKALDDVRNDKYGHTEIISDLKEMYSERINWLKSLKERCA